MCVSEDVFRNYNKYIRKKLFKNLLSLKEETKTSEDGEQGDLDRTEGTGTQGHLPLLPVPLRCWSRPR